MFFMVNLKFRKMLTLNLKIRIFKVVLTRDLLYNTENDENVLIKTYTQVVIHSFLHNFIGT